MIIVAGRIIYSIVSFAISSLNIYKYINARRKDKDMGLKIVSRRDGKNIDSTDNVKRGRKNNTSEKVGKGATFFLKSAVQGGSKKYHVLSEGSKDFI